MSCPVCVCEQVAYTVRAGWLAVVCAWCGIELHGVDLDRLDRGVAREAA